jgi:hypothetical protein
MPKFNETELFAMMTALVAETTIGKRADGEESRTFQVVVADLPLVSIDRVLRYGIQRFINDKVGGSDRDMKTKCDMVSDIIVDLYAGDVSKRRESLPADSMSKFRMDALKEALGKAKVAEINKREDKIAVFTKLLEANKDKLEPRAVELFEEAKRAAEKAKELAAGLDLTF